MYNACMLDVYYVESGISGPQASIADVIKSWDGSLYIETNVLELAGRQEVRWNNSGHISIDGNYINGGLTWDQVQLLAAA